MAGVVFADVALGPERSEYDGQRDTEQKSLLDAGCRRSDDATANLDAELVP